MALVFFLAAWNTGGLFAGKGLWVLDPKKTTAGYERLGSHNLDWIGRIQFYLFEGGIKNFHIG